jgi:beta-lactamase regulating signal transducer with metallopeptidase domain
MLKYQLIYFLIVAQLLPWSVSSPNRSHINLLQRISKTVALVGVLTEQIAHKPAATEYQKLFSRLLFQICKQ